MSEIYINHLKDNIKGYHLLNDSVLNETNWGVITEMTIKKTMSEKRTVEYMTKTSKISSKKQGFSVDTVNSWKSFGKKIFDYYFDKSRLIEDEIINNDWIKLHSKNSDPSVRYVNKFLGILALEIWYRLFITKDLNENEKLTI